MRDLFDTHDPADLYARAATVIEELRAAGSCADVDKIATRAFKLVSEIEALPNGAARARAHHIRNLARYRRMQLKGQIPCPKTTSPTATA